MSNLKKQVKLVCYSPRNFFISVPIGSGRYTFGGLAKLVDATGLRPVSNECRFESCILHNFNLQT
jgi:hypothetical protein